MLNLGAIVGERYEIVAQVGSGGMADVYKAKDHKLNRFVAMKVLKPEFSADTTFIKKFQREAQAAAGLAHPNVVNVFDVGEDQGVNYIVMELVEGITLKDYISKKGKLTVKEATSIAIQVSMGLEAAHNRSIVHRDIKPQNIIISTDGKVKVTDFGIARAASSNTISTNAMGSVHYSSPEQVRGGYSDYKSDIYSLGITMYEMVTGRVPFDGDTTVAIAIRHLQEEIVPPSQYVPSLPHSLEEIILKCTQKSPDRRYSTLAELINDLKRSLLDPDGDFVNLAPLSNHAQTVILSDDEMKQIKRSAYMPPVQPQEEEEDDYNYDYRRNNSRKNYVVDDDDDDDDDEEGDISTKLEKAMTIGGLIIGIIIIAVLVAFIAKAAGLLSFGSGNKDKKPGNIIEKEADDEANQVEVPDILGKTVEEAKAEMKAKGLGLKFDSEKPSDKYEAGEIMEQSIDAGTMVDKNTQIKYVLSSGKSEIKIPDVIGSSQTEAEAELKALGLKTKIEKKNSDEVEIGKVIEVSPEVGASVKEGDVVTLYISIGGGDTSVNVPSVVGQPEAVAKSALQAVGLIVEVTTGESQNVEPGEVYDQSLSSGSKAEVGDTITIYVRKSSQGTGSGTGSGRWTAAGQKLGEPEGYTGGTLKLELMQDVNGELQNTNMVIVDSISGEYSLKDLTGEPGVSTGTLYVYELVGDEYVQRGVYDVTFQEE